MNQQYEPFSKWWDLLAKLLHLNSGEQYGGNVHPLKPRKEKKRRRRWPRWLAAAVVLLGFIFLGRGVYIYTEWLWFGEVGFTSVFWKSLGTKVGLGLGAAAIFFIFVYLNLLVARRMSPRFQVGPGEIVELVPIPDRVMRWLIPLLLLFPALIMLGVGSANWLELLQFLNGSAFGISDPVFGEDVGFFVFTLPFLRTLQSYVWWTLIIALVATTAMHIFDFAINIVDNRLNFAPHVKAHLSVLAGLIMLTLGAGYLLKSYLLMYSTRGVVFGASYTDVHAQLPVLRFLAATAAVAALLFLINIYFKGWKLPLAAIGLIIITAIFAGRVYPFVVQQYQVAPNEQTKEAPYIKNNIDFTRDAFDLNTIEEKPFAASDTLTANEVQTNAPTVNNIRLWEPKTLEQTYNQIQVIRLYYGFSDVDVDRYQIGGRPQQVMLSPREMLVNQLPEQAKTWQNQHLVFTHGYGLVMSPVTHVTGEGLPRLLIKDVPPVTEAPELKVENPAIYFGEQESEYVVVKSATPEFDYPKGDENVYTTYEGSGGVGIGGALERLAFSWRYGSLKLLVSDAVEEQTRIMIHRRIGERINNIAPFLRYDRDPYLVLVDGRLVWVQDAYTDSSAYPYSQPAADGINYIRNSVKVVVDAYDGDVTFYVVDEADPIVNTYRKIFPDLFTSGEQLPPQLRAHLRYPEDLFRIQSQQYATYHMTDPQVFYNKEDQWSIPRLGDKGAFMDPYYVLMGLPGQSREEFMLLTPFTPSTKDNMIAWMAAKSDPESYGERLVYKFPKDKLVYGPAQIQARFNQDTTISAQLTLLNQSGSAVIFGDLLVIPIEESLLYVEPLYLRAERSQIPELKRVLVSFADRVAMEDDLSTALQAIFGAPVPGIAERQPGGETVPGGAPAPPETNLKKLADTAADHYNKAVEAQKRGDWAAYGSELKQLEEALKLMQAAGA